MSDWSQGYPTDTSYIDNAQAEIAPARWNRSLLLVKRQGPATNRPFRFLELGCGSATTLIALAACYPQAEFLGVDFMPEHVVRARQLIDEAELSNVRVEERDFAEMAVDPPAERFDFAAAHGVWTWVDPAVQAQIVSVLNQWLAPGALAYFGYNSAAGWSAAAPLRRIFRAAPRGPAEQRFAPARQAVERWFDLRGTESPALRRLWKKLSEASDEFLSHELGSTNGTGIWPEDLGQTLSGAKMSYACPAVLVEGLDALFLEDDEVAWLREAVGQGWGETARDLMHARTFRNDLFHRGAPLLQGGEGMSRLLTTRVAAWSPEFGFGTHNVPKERMTRHLDPSVLRSIQGAAGTEGRPLAEVLSTLGLDAQAGLQSGLMALAANALIDLRPQAEAEAAVDSCARFNRVVRKRIETDGALIQCLASPAIGGCVTLGSARLQDHLTDETPDAQVAERLAVLGIQPD
ncbi:class I SAM-dependent methyltransferase [Thetidibacter halocola]|uniref:Methyltransferase domain-containing protein n=1 Tax=Thetidibacter halocola TaxID=2827239 RepID=A0A8J8B9J6_9RHOB|nr:class I SAM-dependent methyltransferase [Thetidibacter halocola]MBS0125929.1 methyltransferase domain-containing protein [Thetidibacter halocola]